MITFFSMSLYGAAMTAVILVLRRLLISAIPKKTFKILWLLTAARLLVPLFIPLPIYVKAAAEVTGEAVSERVPKGLIFAVWAAGAAVSAGIFAAAYIKGLRKFRAANRVYSSELSHMIGGFGLRRRVETRVCRGASSPVTYGLFRPRIILPENFSEYGTEQISCAVLHEMQHIISLDALYKPIIAAAASLHWFNPAAWAMLIMAGRDAEIACDEAVLKKIGSEKREEYALALLACEESRGGIPVSQAFAKNAIKERIELVMKYKKSAAAAVIAAAAVVGCTAAVFALSPQFRTVSEPVGTADAEPYSDSTETEQNNGVIRHSDGVIQHSDGVEAAEGENIDDSRNKNKGIDVRATKDVITINGKEVEVPPGCDLELTYDDNTVYIIFPKKDNGGTDTGKTGGTIHSDGIEPAKEMYGKTAVKVADIEVSDEAVTVDGLSVWIPSGRDWELKTEDDFVYVVFTEKDETGAAAVDYAVNVMEVRRTVNIDGTELKLPPKAGYGEMRSVPEGERSSGEDAAKLLEACFDGAEDFSYPVDSAYIGGYSYNGGFTIPAQKGEAVCSMLDGRVIYADMSFPFGNAAVIDHGGGSVWLYAHCNDLDVSAGDIVSAGDVIGHVGSTGATPDNQLFVYKY